MAVLISVVADFCPQRNFEKPTMMILFWLICTAGAVVRQYVGIPVSDINELTFKNNWATRNKEPKCHQQNCWRCPPADEFPLPDEITCRGHNLKVRSTYIDFNWDCDFQNHLATLPACFSVVVRGLWCEYIDPTTMLHGSCQLTYTVDKIDCFRPEMIVDIFLLAWTVVFKSVYGIILLEGG